MNTWSQQQHKNYMSLLLTGYECKPVKRLQKYHTNNSNPGSGMMQFHVKNELANWHGMCCVSRGFAPVAFSVVAEMCVTGLIALCLYGLIFRQN